MAATTPHRASSLHDLRTLTNKLVAVWLQPSSVAQPGARATHATLAVACPTLSLGKCEWGAAPAPAVHCLWTPSEGGRWKSSSTSQSAMSAAAQSSACTAPKPKRSAPATGPVRVGASTCASVPSPMDALGGVLEVQLHALVDVARVAGHDHRPARVAGGHAGHVEALLPLLVDPLEGEAVRHLRPRDLSAACRKGFSCLLSKHTAKHMRPVPLHLVACTKASTSRVGLDATVKRSAHNSQACEGAPCRTAGCRGCPGTSPPGMWIT